MAVKEGAIPWNKGIAMSKEQKDKLSNSLKKYYLENPYQKMMKTNIRISL